MYKRNMWLTKLISLLTSLKIQLTLFLIQFTGYCWLSAWKICTRAQYEQRNNSGESVLSRGQSPSKKTVKMSSIVFPVLDGLSKMDCFIYKTYQDLLMELPSPTYSIVFFLSCTQQMHFYWTMHADYLSFIIDHA